MVHYQTALPGREEGTFKIVDYDEEGKTKTVRYESPKKALQNIDSNTLNDIKKISINFEKIRVAAWKPDL